MASAQHTTVPRLSGHFEVGGDAPITFEEATQKVVGWKLESHPTVCLKKDRLHEKGAITVWDLPLRPFGTRSYKMITYVDLVSPYEGDIDFEGVHTLCSQGRFRELAEPLRLKVEPLVPYTLQLAIIRDDPPDESCRKYIILKHVCFDRERVDAASIRAMCHGEAHQIEYGRNFRNGAAAFHVMFEQLKGFQIKFNTLKLSSDRSKTIDSASRTAGYAHIRENGPRSNNRNQFMEWADEETNTQGSPIYGWQMAQVQQALQNYNKGRTNAKPLSFWVLTLKDFAGWFVENVLKHMLGSMHQHGILWVGKSRIGKSNGSKTLAFLYSEYKIRTLNKASTHEASVLTAKHMDFFKAEPCTQILPGIFDDGPVKELPADILKSFLNPKEEDALVWARWGGATFDQGSSRQMVSNPYSKAAEDRAIKSMNFGAYALDHFKAIIAPSLESVDEDEDFTAILARAHVIVATDKGVHWRAASEDSAVGAKFMEWPEGGRADLFGDDCRPGFQAYLDNPKSCDYPIDFADKMDWSLKYFDNLVQGRPVDPITTTLTRSVFNDRKPRLVFDFGNSSTETFETARAARMAQPSTSVRPATASPLVGYAHASLVPRHTAAASSDNWVPHHGAVIPVAQAGIEAVVQNVNTGGASFDDCEEAPVGHAGVVDAPEDDALRGVQPSSVMGLGCGGPLSAEDVAERNAIFASMVAASHGQFIDLSSPSPKRKQRRLNMACGGPLSPEDIEEQQAIFASLAATLHGELVDVSSTPPQTDDLDGPMRVVATELLESGHAWESDQLVAKPRGHMQCLLVALNHFFPSSHGWSDPAAWADGPFSASDINDYTQRPPQHAAGNLSLVLQEEVHSAFGGGVEHVVVRVGRSSSSHWFGAMSHGPEVTIVDGLLTNVVRARMADFLDALTASAEVAVFQIKQWEGPLPRDGEYAVKGGGGPAGSPPATKVFITPLVKCVQPGCVAELRCVAEEIPADLISFNGAEKVIHRVKRCCDRAHCGTRYHYNYRWIGARKLNTVSVEDVSVLFVNGGLAFDINFIRYHEALAFRGYLSSRAIAWASEKVLCGGAIRYDLAKRITDAKMLFLAMEEFQALEAARPSAAKGLLRSIEVGNEVTQASLDMYDDWLHATQFPPKSKKHVTHFVMDGHQKVMSRLCAGEATPKRGGFPRKFTPKQFTNGWFMIMDPQSHHVISMTTMHHPENNDVVTRSLEKIVNLYPNANCGIYDRACKYIGDAKKSKLIAKRIKYWSVDPSLHAKGHAKTCPCNPLYVKILAKAVKGVNDQICEQTFSWFKGFASVLNNMSPLRHRFLVLNYCHQHNSNLRKGTVDYLSPFSRKRCKRGVAKKPSSNPYYCRTGNAAPSKRVLKKPGEAARAKPMKRVLKKPASVARN